MGSLITAQVDLLSLPDTRVVDMEDEEGNIVEYVCLPVKKAGLKRYKRKIILPISILPLKHPITWKTHLVLPDWGLKYIKENQYGKQRPILGNAKISFMYYEQSAPEPFKISSMNEE